MSGAGVEQLLYLMDAAFEADDWHSMLGNLRSVRAEDWTWRPEGGGRSIALIAGHVAAAKVIYDSHTFGNGQLGWSDPTLTQQRSLEETIAWLREGHAALRERVAALDDGELLKPRRVHWGEQIATRDIIRILINHDVYHAGEINHIRALHQGDDR